jgi:phosphatidylserine/phosphatidylglycerophosphate/cardiolipin synthase-like enzyme
VLHRKALVADDRAFLSSFNVSERSLKHDHELGITSTDPRFVSTVSGLLEEDMSRATVFTPDAHDGYRALVGDFLAKHVSY